MHRQFPRWMIDDTSGVTDGRVFVAHMQTPRFVGELMPDDEHDPAGVTIAAPGGQTICRIEWFDEPGGWSADFHESLARALDHHDAVRGGVQ